MEASGPMYAFRCRRLTVVRAGRAEFLRLCSWQPVLRQSDKGLQAHACAVTLVAGTHSLGSKATIDLVAGAQPGFLSEPVCEPARPLRTPGIRAGASHAHMHITGGSDATMQGHARL